MNFRHDMICLNVRGIGASVSPAHFFAVSEQDIIIKTQPSFINTPFFDILYIFSGATAKKASFLFAPGQ